MANIPSNFLPSLSILILLYFASTISAQANDNICEEVQCGRGRCEANPNIPFNFRCICDNGWKRTRLNDERDLEYLPCIIPDCSLDYSCMPAAPPLPPVPNNLSFFDPCYWIYCGQGICTKSSTYKHTCQCNYGFYNLLNISAFPCYSDCALGSDCQRLGIQVSRSSSSSNPSNNNNGYYNQATSLLPGRFHWIAMLLILALFLLRK